MPAAEPLSAQSWGRQRETRRLVRSLVRRSVGPPVRSSAAIWTSIGEGIKITFGDGLLFDVDRSDLRPEAQAELVKLADILQKYDDTNVLVEGHTDATGTEQYNMDLSLRRSSSVATFLAFQGVDRNRLDAVGYGELQPIATNETSAGRQQNRRVEVAIWANDDLKAAAKRQAQG